MAYRLLRFLCIVGAAIIAACSGGGSPPVPTAPLPPNAGNNAPTLQVGPYTASFKEYALPAGQSSAGDITVGPDGAVWFTVNDGIDRIESSGIITAFPAPSGVSVVFPGIASASGALWYGVSGIFPSDPEPQQPLVRQATSGTPSLGPVMPPDTTLLHIRTGPDGVHLWVPLSILNLIGSVESFTSSGFAARADLPANFPQVLDVAFGADGNVYATAMGLSSPNSVVFKISSSGTILNQFNLPDGTNPMGITAGPDGALWIALSGSNSIGRLTATGTLTQYVLPTPNALPFEIIKGSDGALWFTEQHGNKLGRITTAGSITEYTIPTPNAQPYGLTTCPQQCENAHGRIWFTESGAGKVAKFEF